MMLWPQAWPISGSASYSHKMATTGPSPSPAVARNAGWWWPYAEVVLLTERPSVLELDEAGRLHRGDGPALAWADGFALHAWRGMPVPASLFERLGALTSEPAGCGRGHRRRSRLG